MTTTLKRCLIIDDDESFRQLITRYINVILPEVIVEEYDPSTAGSPPTDFDWTGCDLVILDYFLNTPLTGLDLLNKWKQNENFPAVIMMTAAGSEDIAVRAMKTGVQDYFRKQNITKENLKQAILDAVQNRAAERERRISNTHSSQSFNKSLFYKKLEQVSDSTGSQQLFVLVELDQFDELGEIHGVVLQDKLARHAARTAYTELADDSYATSMTRMSDDSIGLLFTLQHGRTFTDELKDLKKRLDGNPLEHEGQPLHCTVSIGAVSLAKSGNRANDIIRQARAMCQRVHDKGGNGISVYEADSSTTTAASPATPASDPPSTAEDTKPQAAEQLPSPTPEPANHPADSDTARQAPPTEEDLLEMTLELPAEALRGQSPQPTTSANSDFDILQAFKDNRVLQYYQPIMPLSDAANQLEQECYSIRIRMVDTDGAIISPDSILPELRELRNQKLLDRWILRQTVSRIISLHNQRLPTPLFLIKLSEESFADADLFNWLQSKLMKPLGEFNVGKSLYIEVAAETYLARKRQVEAMFKFLRQSYNFRFALSSFDSVEQINNCAEQSRFDMYKISQSLFNEIQSQQTDPIAIPKLVSSLRQRGCLVVSTFIEDAAMLTHAINCGADFAMGYFIGTPIDNIGNANQIESFELT